MSEEERETRVNKVITVDGGGDAEERWSQQLPADPFQGTYQAAGLQEPPFPLEQLVFLAEVHPTHAAILEQKAADICGTGWEWEPTAGEDEEEQPDEAERRRLDGWFHGLAEDEETDQTSHEILLAAINDWETIGHGCIELARDKGKDRKLRHWFHLPAHTTRFHVDGIRLAQVRNGRRVWFKRWIPGDDRVVDAVSGGIYESEKDIPARGRLANEVFVIRRPSRRSSWYGLPTYIPATGWITLSTAARDDNLMFFENKREPRWAIVLENVEDDPGLEERIKRAFRSDLKKAHRNIVLALNGAGKVHFQQLGDNKGDLSFERLQDRADQAILMAHRMPGERIGFVRVGSLGGTAVNQATRVYKEAYVQTAQALLSARINKLIAAESGTEHPHWTWRPQELDLTEEGADQARATAAFQGGVLTLNEARKEMGYEALEEEPLPDADGEMPEAGDPDERGDKFFFELAPQAAAAAAQGTYDQGALDQANQKLSQDIASMIGGQSPVSPAPAPENDGEDLSSSIQLGGG